MKYSIKLVEKIEKKIPEKVREALLLLGWNELGIYEVVKEEIDKHKNQHDTHSTQQ